MLLVTVEGNAVNLNVWSSIVNVKSSGFFVIFSRWQKAHLVNTTDSGEFWSPQLVYQAEVPNKFVTYDIWSDRVYCKLPLPWDVGQCFTAVNWKIFLECVSEDGRVHYWNVESINFKLYRKCSNQIRLPSSISDCRGTPHFTEIVSQRTSAAKCHSACPSVEVLYSSM